MTQPVTEEPALHNYQLTFLHHVTLPFYATTARNIPQTITISYNVPVVSTFCAARYGRRERLYSSVFRPHRSFDHHTITVVVTSNDTAVRLSSVTKLCDGRDSVDPFVVGFRLLRNFLRQSTPVTAFCITTVGPYSGVDSPLASGVSNSNPSVLCTVVGGPYHIRSFLHWDVSVTVLSEIGVRLCIYGRRSPRCRWCRHGRAVSVFGQRAAASVRTGGDSFSFLRDRTVAVVNGTNSIVFYPSVGYHRSHHHYRRFDSTTTL